MRDFWFEFGMLGAAIAALFVLIPAFRPRTKIAAGVLLLSAVLLTASNFYLKAYTGIGLEDRVICYVLPQGPACVRILGRNSSSTPDADGGASPSVTPQSPDYRVGTPPPESAKEPPRPAPEPPASPPSHERGDATPAMPQGPIHHRVFTKISLEEASDPEKSQVAFPFAYFQSRLGQELGISSTTLSSIRVGVAFIEPYESRRLSAGGTIIGYLLVTLPDLGNCRRKFGTQAYSFQDASTGIMKAINDHVREIADWIRRASEGENLKCLES